MKLSSDLGHEISDPKLTVKPKRWRLDMKVFISYRRRDSQYIADHIDDSLVPEFGRANVFKDVDSIPYGRDFRQFLQDAVTRCDDLLVVIGLRWLGETDAAGRRRVDDPGDWTRIEVETALTRDIPVIPLLVDGAPLPRKEDLPSSLQELVYRHGMPVRPGPDFRVDIGRLIRALRAVPASPPEDITSGLEKGPPGLEAEPSQVEERFKGKVTFMGCPIDLVGPKLKPGDRAPDFSCVGEGLTIVSLADTTGKARIFNVVASLDTPTCQKQTRRFAEELKALGDKAAAYTVSLDSPFAQLHFCIEANIENMKNLSDVHNLSFGQHYGVLIEGLPIPLLARAVFVVDPNDKIKYVEIVPEISHEPNYEFALKALKAAARA